MISDKFRKDIAQFTLFLAGFYGHYSPIPWKKWQICTKILSLARINPWHHSQRWKNVVRKLPPKLISVRGFQIMCDWQDSTYLGLLMVGDHEPYTCEVFEKIIRSGDVILDVGANIGFMSLLLALQTGPHGRVYAYEPVSATAQKLIDNIKINEALPKSDIVVWKKGLGDRAMSVPIYLRCGVSGTSIDSGHSSLLANFSTSDHRVIVEQIEVARLDDEHIEERIDFVKCDVEGAEMLFLAGGLIRLSRDKPLILIEWNPGPNTYSAKDMVRLIRSIGGYDFFAVTRHGLSRKSADELKTHKGGNILCAIRQHHSDRLAELVG